MNGPSSSLIKRLARLAWPHRNPLARGSDRVESATLVAVVVAALLLGPVMLVFGSIVHADMVAEGEQEARTRHAAAAVLTRDAPDTGLRGPGSSIGNPNVPATWTLPDGTTGTGRVTAPSDTKAGAKIDIWLDQDGRVAERPLTAADAALGGAVVALSGWLSAVVLLVAAQTGLRLLLNRRRYRAWDRQWERVEPGWSDHRR